MDDLTDMGKLSSELLNQYTKFCCPSNTDAVFCYTGRMQSGNLTQAVFIAVFPDLLSVLSLDSLSKALALLTQCKTRLNFWVHYSARENVPKTCSRRFLLVLCDSVLWCVSLSSIEDKVKHFWKIETLKKCVSFDNDLAKYKQNIIQYKCLPLLETQITSGIKYWNDFSCMYVLTYQEVSFST